MRKQIAKTTKEAQSEFQNQPFTVPAGTPVEKVPGGIGYVNTWYVSDFGFIKDDKLRAEVAAAGLPVADDCVENVE